MDKRLARALIYARSLQYDDRLQAEVVAHVIIQVAGLPVSALAPIADFIYQRRDTIQRRHLTPEGEVTLAEMQETAND